MHKVYLQKLGEKCGLLNEKMWVSEKLFLHHVPADFRNNFVWYLGFAHAVIFFGHLEMS